MDFSLFCYDTPSSYNQGLAEYCFLDKKSIFSWIKELLSFYPFVKASIDLERSTLCGRICREHPDFSAIFYTKKRKPLFFFRASTVWPEEKRKLYKDILEHLLSSSICTPNFLYPKNSPYPFLIHPYPFGEKNQKIQIRISHFFELEPIVMQEDQLFQTGKALATLHQSLTKIPCQNSIKTLAKKRLKYLQEGLQWIKEENFKGVFFERLKKNYAPENTFSLGEQVLHGDLTLGNVWRTKKNIAFLDFEDCCFSFGPAWRDVFWLVQRFLMRDNPLLNVLKNRLVPFMKGYFSLKSGTHFHNLIQKQTDYSLMFAQHSYQSLCSLAAQKKLFKHTFAAKEWEKFLQLEAQAHRYQEHLPALFEESLR